MRGYAREVAFCTLYKWNMTSNKELELEYYDQDKLAEEDLNFVNALVGYAVSNVTDINQVIDTLSHSFKADRMYKSDITALQLAIAECCSCDTPAPVVAGEIVSIVKKYSTEKSSSFVNGILAEYIRRQS